MRDGREGVLRHHEPFSGLAASTTCFSTHSSNFYQLRMIFLYYCDFSPSSKNLFLGNFSWLLLMADSEKICLDRVSLPHSKRWSQHKRQGLGCTTSIFIYGVSLCPYISNHMYFQYKVNWNSCDFTQQRIFNQSYLLSFHPRWSNPVVAVASCSFTQITFRQNIVSYPCSSMLNKWPLSHDIWL